MEFFGPLKEQLEDPPDELAHDRVNTVQEVLNHLKLQCPSLNDQSNRLAVAHNEEVLEDEEQDRSVKPGDTVALMPPFGGGSAESSETSSHRIDLVPSDDEMDLATLVDFVNKPGNGGLATFTGSVRATNEERQVKYLEYESYEPAARAELQDIFAEAQEEWNQRGPLKLAAVHRTGRVKPGQAAVIVAVGAPHRAEALEACRYVIDELKGRVPIWKKEVFESGETWVENSEALEGKEADQ